ncbi:MAG TPA: lysylphosphatidylglycerol synthase transmembrane domain-containing protein [Solirubrobacteraceae bacterium]|nr:lysylphosphatidylglycerol synthase transmembrane domain-containing protein [Solirubrobacteraceae bacterium]
MSSITKSQAIPAEAPIDDISLEDIPIDEASIDETSDELAAHSRTLRNSIISLAIFFGIIVALLLAVPGLHSVEERISDANSWWLAAAVGLELLSCAGYVVLFGRVFGMLGKRLVSRLSLSELAVNSVVSVSGLAGLALGAWVLRSKGVSVERIAKRSVLLFVLTSAVNVGAVVVIGMPMWLGLLPGSRNPLLTLLPAMAALAAIIGTLVLAAWARRTAARRPLEHGRWAVTLVALSGGVEDAVRLIRERDWRVLGAVAYWLFDNLALYACLAAFGATPVVWVVAMAYLVGMLANSLPIPGGFVAVEGGLVGMLVLFGVRPASTVVAAVVVYRAISLWIPALIGSLAFLSLRREIGKPLKPGAVGATGF